MSKTECFEHKISGINVKFPHENPYPAQKALMAAVINAFRNNHNALLESPTGTGKSIALLASSLAYREEVEEPEYKDENRELTIKRQYLGFFPPYKHQIPGEPVFSKILYENIPQSDFYYAQVDKPPDESTEKIQKKAPAIWYSSRTHQQLKQLVGEIKKLPYHPQMCILAARSHVCLWKRALDSDDIDGFCFEARKTQSCPFDKHKSIPKEFKPYGCYEKFELEDLLSYCQKNKYCPYSVSREMMRIADIVFCPYNYFLDPKIKGQMQLDLTGTRIIIDEAHNVECVCRDNGSFTFSRPQMEKCMILIRKRQKERPQITPVFQAFNILLDIIFKILRWFDNSVSMIKERGDSEYIVENNEEMLSQWSISLFHWPRVLGALDCVFKIGNQMNTPPCIDEKSVPMPILVVFERLWVMFSLCLKNRLKNINDYRVVVQIDGNGSYLKGLVMNPGIVFEWPATEAKSIILTSGTLSPLSVLERELGKPFKIQLSAPHVITPNQVQCFTITENQKGFKFLSTHKYLEGNRININISLGEFLLTLLPSIPYGAILFLPSHYFLTQLAESWKLSGYLKKINEIKTVFFEEPNDSGTIEEYRNAVEGGGGLLVGVYRGRASEGIDFTDDQARAVFAFGIPFPQINSLEVRLKRQYNNDFMSGSGNEWYESQAFRALSQAIGRCIRHKNDYGAIFLIDERFPNEENRLPKWIKSSLYSSLTVDDIYHQLKFFYSIMSKSYPTKAVLKKGLPAIFVCSECKTKLYTLSSLDSDEIVSVPFSGLQSNPLENSTEFTYLIIKSTDKLKHDIEFGEVSISQNDKIVYQPCRCKCGKIAAFRIIAASSRDIQFIDSFLIISSSVLLLKNGIAYNLKSKKPKKLLLSQSSSNQTKLSFQ